MFVVRSPTDGILLQWHAQNDIYMVCADGSSNDDTTAESLENGSLARAELQRNAANICGFLMTTNAMKTLLTGRMNLR